MKSFKKFFFSILLWQLTSSGKTNLVDRVWVFGTSDISLGCHFQLEHINSVEIITLIYLANFLSVRGRGGSTVTTNHLMIGTCLCTYAMGSLTVRLLRSNVIFRCTHT